MANVNLKKIPKVNLTKNQVVCLTKDGNEESDKLDEVYFGSNWSAIHHNRKPKGITGLFSSLVDMVFGDNYDEDEVENVDLDSSILMYDENCRLVDRVCYYNLVSECRAIRHSGDDTTGDLEDDDDDNETISIKLSKVNKKVKFLVVILNSYRHHKFNEIPYVGLRIYTGKLGKPDEVLASYKVDNNPDFNGKEAIILGYFYRSASGWKFKADGTATSEMSITSIENGSALRLVRNHKD